MARPKLYNIDGEQVEKLAGFGCTNIEIASFFGCNESLIRKSYSEYIAKGKQKGKIRLKQLMWRSAENGNVAMQIYLSKNLLGYSDSPSTPEDALCEGFELNAPE